MDDDTGEILRAFARTTDEVVTLNELRERLQHTKKLRIKYGVDVTAPFLHLGHAVNLWMMRELQERGHTVVFLLGDFTTRVGDPTGKSKTRPVLSQQQIDTNARAFIDQVGLILHTDADVFEVRRNAEWYDQMPTRDFFALLSMVTHARLIGRDMFERRLAEHHEIYMHEFVYPLLQGYDSCMIHADLTIVGADQLFNEMMGRFFQERFNQPPQVIITTKITPGTDGKEKQSKSLGNYIGLLDSPRDKFGKIMRIPDPLIIPYYEVYTTVPLATVRQIQDALEQGQINPMEPKLELARTIVERYHGVATAQLERDSFVRTFSQRTTPEQMPDLRLHAGTTTVLDLLKQADPEVSNSQWRRLCDQNALRIDTRPIRRLDDIVEVESGSVLQIGRRRWFRLVVPGA